MKHVVYEIEDHRINHENETKQLQTSFSIRLEEFEEQTNQRTHEQKGSNDAEDLKRVIEKLEEENIKLKKENEDFKAIKATYNT